MLDYHGVQIPQSADEWQLYDMSGSGRAARSLTAHAQRAVDRIRRARLSNASTVARRAQRDLLARCDHYADVGAADTEPQCVARDVVRGALRSVGLDPNRLVLGEW